MPSHLKAMGLLTYSCGPEAKLRQPPSQKSQTECSGIFFNISEKLFRLITCLLLINYDMFHFVIMVKYHCPLLEINNFWVGKLDALILLLILCRFIISVPWNQKPKTYYWKDSGMTLCLKRLGCLASRLKWTHSYRWPTARSSHGHIEVFLSWKCRVFPSDRNFIYPEGPRPASMAFPYSTGSWAGVMALTDPGAYLQS